jgi:hypothetical protein
MLNDQSARIEDDDGVILFEQVVGQLIEQSIATNLLSKSQVIGLLEDMIQQVERGTLTNTLNCT